MNLTFDIQQEDIAEHYNALWRQIGKVSITGQVVDVALWALIAVVYLYFFGPIDTSHIVLFFTVVIACGLSEWVRTKRLRSKVVNDEANPALGTQTMKFDGKGICYSNQFSSGEVLWDGIRRTDETGNLFRFFIGSFEAILIPKRFVENEAEFREVIDNLRRNA